MSEVLMMEGTTEKDCSPLWNLYQQIVSDMKNSAPMWEEFISKATKLHSALKSALVAIAHFLDSFQKIADAATNARGATKDIGTALTRVCLRHRAIETKMKTFISTLMDTLIVPLSERTEEWRRGSGTGALSRDHARECKRVRAELRRKVTDAQRHVRKARRAPDAKRRADVTVQDVQERKTQLEEMEENAVKAALIEERSRYCHFVTLLNPVVECEVAMLAEAGHLQEGSEQLMRHIAEPNTLPAPTLQVICDIMSSSSNWRDCSSGPPSPSPSCRLGSRKSSFSSICSTSTQSHEIVSNSTVNCSTPISNASSAGTLPLAGNDSQNSLSQLKCGGRLASVCSSDSGFRSQEGLHRQLSLYVDHGSDTQSVSSASARPARSTLDNTDSSPNEHNNAASVTWPDLKDTAQFERAASAIMGGRPHTISAAYERGHPRPALSVHTFSSQNEVTPREPAIYARPPLPTRCSSLERPSIPARSGSSLTLHDGNGKMTKPSSLPHHLTKEMSQCVYVNMSELANMAASRAQQQQQQQQQNNHQTEQHNNEKGCSESSASESSLESSSGYGSQGAFAGEDHQQIHNIQLQHAEVEIESEIVTLRRDRSTDAMTANRDSFSISLGSLEEAVRSLDEVCESQTFATIGKKPAVPKRRPLSMTASVWSRRGSAASLGKPPPPVRRCSSISRAQYTQGNNQSPSNNSHDAENLPPPPAFLLQPENDSCSAPQSSVAETIKQLNELKHCPASPGLARRQLANQQQPPLSTFQHNAPIGHSGQRLLYGRKSGLNASATDLYNVDYGDANMFYGTRNNSTCGIYAQPVPINDAESCRSPPTIRRAPSADRRRSEQSSLIASLSAKLAPQLSPRTTRRAISSISPAEPNKTKAAMSASVQPGFLDKLSITIQQQRRQLEAPRANTVREIINATAQPDPRASHTSLMEQIKRGATLKRNKQCNDRSAPKIR